MEHLERAWPAPYRKFRHYLMSDDPPFTAIVAYAGMSVVVYWCLVAVTTVGAIGLMAYVIIANDGGHGSRLIVLPVLVGIVLIMAVLGALLKPGALIARAGGIQFVPYDPTLTRPKRDTVPVFPWFNVEVDAGDLSRVRVVEGPTLRIASKNKAFCVAALRYAGRAVR